jgi:hypothetical protein
MRLLLASTGLPAKPSPTECKVYIYGPHAGESAAWRRARFSHAAYMETDGSSPWALVRGWHLDIVFKDICHIMYLGVCRDVAGTMLYECALLVLEISAFLRGPLHCVPHYSVQYGLRH